MAAGIMRRAALAGDGLATAAVVHAPALSGRLAAFLADLHRGCGALRSDSLSESLAIAFPDASERELRRLDREFWRSKYRRWVEHRQLESLSPSALVRYARTHVEIEGEEHLQEALECPEAVVAFTPHYGHFLLATLRFALEAQGRKQMFLFYNPPEKNPYTPTMSRLFARLGSGAESVFNNRAGVLRVSKGLAHGGALGIMPDVYELEPGAMFVPFFGKFLICMAGTAFFTLRFAARLLPVYCRRVGPDRFALEVDPPLVVGRKSSSPDDVFDLTAAIARNMETHIRRAPEHWVYWENFRDRVARAISLPPDACGWRRELAGLRERYRSHTPPLTSLLAELEGRLAGPGGLAGNGPGNLETEERRLW
ncbi:MAG TPA: hypothetical protein VF580_01955 [Thermoanaerobaculia bacterium]